MEKWDNRERNGGRNPITPLGNFKLLIFIGILLFAIMFAYITFFVPQVDADGDNFKVFENGVTYSDGCDGEPSWFYRPCEILYNNERYLCNPITGGGTHSWLSPVCVEIISRLHK